MSRLETLNIAGRTVVFDARLVERKAELRDALASDELKKLLSKTGERTVAVLGWDGTMLRAVKAFYGENAPFLGVNFWTKGFLLSDPAVLGRSDAKFMEFEYPLLDVRFESENFTSEGKAFNEAQIKTAWGHLVSFDVEIGSHSGIRLRGDGLLVVTPAGTTGYNASAWGPVLPHESPHLVVTPLLPFEPKRQSATVYDGRETVTVRELGERPAEFSVYADADPVAERVVWPAVVTVKKARETVRILIEERDVAAWKARIFREQGFDILD